MPLFCETGLCLASVNSVLFDAGAIVAPYAVKEDEDRPERSDDNIYYDALNIWVSAEVYELLVFECRGL